MPPVMLLLIAAAAIGGVVLLRGQSSGLTPDILANGTNPPSNGGVAIGPPGVAPPMSGGSGAFTFGAPPGPLTTGDPTGFGMGIRPGGGSGGIGLIDGTPGPATTGDPTGFGMGIRQLGGYLGPPAIVAGGSFHGLDQ